jgi:hypothetical protein
MWRKTRRVRAFLGLLVSFVVLAVKKRLDLESFFNVISRFALRHLYIHDIAFMNNLDRGVGIEVGYFLLLTFFNKIHETPLFFLLVMLSYFSH